MFSRIPFDRVQWVTSAFLIGTLATALTAVPWYIWHFGLDWFQVGLFFFYCCATGLSITLGYHRLFSHFTFKAKTPVKLFTLLFGAAAFENSVLDWSSDHRRHHKHVDHDDDPYDITKGFWWAHIGWMLFKLKPEPPMDNVKDLERDPLVRWQHRYVHVIGAFVGFVVPAILGYLWNGWSGALGGFLLAGVLRVVLVQHATFCINSMCHYVGAQPYSSKCSARDSWLMALFTFGEGYHNFHHEFQYDYRNGVKPWHFDPTKWTIWVLHRLGLVSDLRTVPDEKILLAELREAQRRLEEGLQEVDRRARLCGATRAKVESSRAYLAEKAEALNAFCEELQQAARERISLSREHVVIWRKEAAAALRQLERLEAELPRPVPSLS